MEEASPPHLWPQLLVVADEDQLLCGLANAREDVRLQHFARLFHQNDLRPYAAAATWVTQKICCCCCRCYA